MSSNINWTGNKVLDPGGKRPMAQPAAAAVDTPPGNAVTQPGTVTPPSGTITTPPSGTITTPPENTITEAGPPPVSEKGYIPNYLIRNIGRFVKAEFIIGSNQFVDKTGVIKEVGVNYFVLYDANSKSDIMCDLYSVKFVTIVQNQNVLTQ